MILAAPSLMPWCDPVLSKLPGAQPHEGPLFRRDAAFAAQMGERDRLVREVPDRVMAMLPEAEDAVAETVDVVEREAGGCLRPDGVHVAGSALEQIARLVQEDVLVLDGPRGQHKLVAGTLCFPSRWSLREKLGRGLPSIHAPVPFYAGDLEQRVQRFFDALRVEQPLWRANWLFYPVPDLHMPREEADREEKGWTENTGLYLRVERQVLKRLPDTGAVLFIIKTDVCDVQTIPQEEIESLQTALHALKGAEAEYKGRDEVLRRIEATVRFAH